MISNIVKRWQQKHAQENLFKRDQISFKEEFRILEELDMERSSAKMVDFFLVKNDLDLAEYKVKIQNVAVKSYADNSAWYDGSANGIIIGPEGQYPIRINLTNGDIWTVSLLEQKISQVSPDPSYIQSPVRELVEDYRNKKYLPDQPAKPFRKKPTLRTPEILGRPRLKRTAQARSYLVHVLEYEPFTVWASSPEGALSKYLNTLLAKARESTTGEPAVYHEEELYYSEKELSGLIEKLKLRGLENYVSEEFGTVPYLIGRTFDQSKKLIEDQGLVVEELAHETLPGMGTVIEQIPYSDKDVPKGTAVKIKLGHSRFEIISLKKLALELNRVNFGQAN